MKKRLIYSICGLICSLSIFASTAPQIELIHAETTFKKHVKAIIENGDTIALYELPPYGCIHL